MSIRYSEVVVTTIRAGIPLLCFILMGFGAAGAAQEIEQLLAEGRGFFEEGDFRKAVQAFEAADDLANGEAAEPLMGLASAYYRLGRYRKAVEIAERLVQREVGKQALVKAYNLLGIALYMKDQTNVPGLERAESALRKVLDLVGDGESAISPQYSLAAVLQALGRDREAADLLRSLLERFPDGESESLDRVRVSLCRIRASMTSEEEGASAHQENGHGRSPTWGDSDETPDRLSDGASESAGNVGGEVQPPKKIFTPQPHYPTDSLQKRVQGEVIVQAVIDKLGCVTKAKVLKGLRGDMDRNAVDAISHWVFRPARLEGMPVDVYYNMTVAFKLERR